MDRRLRNRILFYLLLAGVLAFVMIKVSGRKPVAKISAVMPTRENLASSITSNGKVEPIEPYVMRAQLDTFVEKAHAKEGQQVKKGQLLLELNVKDASAQLSEAQSKLLRAQEDLRAAKAGGRTDSAAQVTGDLAKTQAERDRLQKNHEALVRLIAQQAATQEELAANDLALAKAQAEVTRLAAAKQEFDRAEWLDYSAGGWDAVFAAGEGRGFREAGGLTGGDGGPAQGSRACVYRRAGIGRAGTKPAGENYLGRAAESELDGEDRNYSEAGGGARIAKRGRTALLGEQRQAGAAAEHERERANQFAGTTGRAGGAARRGGGPGRAAVRVRGKEKPAGRGQIETGKAGDPGGHRGRDKL